MTNIKYPERNGYRYTINNQNLVDLKKSIFPQEQKMAKTVDNDAPKSLILEFRTPDGEVWGTLNAESREFKTGSVGFYANGKVKNPKNGLPYQIGSNIILVGSKG